MLLCRAPHSGELQEGRGSEHMAGSWGALGPACATRNTQQSLLGGGEQNQGEP